MNADDPSDPSDPRHPRGGARRARLIDGGLYGPSISGSPHCDSRALPNESAVQRMKEAGKELGPAPRSSHDDDDDDDEALYAGLPLDLSSEKSSLKRTSKDDKYSSSRDGVSEDSKRAAEDDGDNNSNSNSKKRSWSTHMDDNHANVYNNPTEVPGDLKRTSNDYQCSNNNSHTGVPGELRSTGGFPGDVKQEPHETVYPSAVESTSRQNLLGPLPPPLPILASPGLASQLEPIPAAMQEKVREFLQTNPAKKCDTKDDYKARVLECKVYGRQLTGIWHGKKNTAKDTWICHVQLKHKLFLRINVDGSETLWTYDDRGNWKRNVHTDMFRDPASRLYRRLWSDEAFFDKWNKTCRKNPRTNLDSGFSTVAKAFLIVGRGQRQFERCLKQFWNSAERKACEQEYRAEQRTKSTPQPQGAAYNFSPGAFAPGALSPGATNHFGGVHHHYYNCSPPAPALTFNNNNNNDVARGAHSPGATNYFGGVHNHYYNSADSPPATAPTFNNNNNNNSSNEDDEPEAVLPAPAPSFNNGSNDNNNGNGP